jgi:hypothetical protein
LVTLTLLSVHTGDPLPQVSVPVWHGFEGVHDAPLVHEPQTPAEQTWFVPHEVPFCWFPVSSHTGTPVPHEVFPTLHAFGGWHAFPSAHGEQTPALQTLSVPQLIPSTAGLPVSTHPTVGEHTVVPMWHGFVGVHARPTVQATHMPALQTRSVPHEVPFGTLADSMQTGVPVLHAVVPVRQALPGMEHDAPAVHAPQLPVALQTMSLPQAVPAATLVPVSVQVDVPPVHDSVPV